MVKKYSLMRADVFLLIYVERQTRVCVRWCHSPLSIVLSDWDLYNNKCHRGHPVDPKSLNSWGGLVGHPCFDCRSSPFLPECMESIGLFGMSASKWLVLQIRDHNHNHFVLRVESSREAKVQKDRDVSQTDPP